MRTIDTISFTETDPRVRKYLLPTRIVLTEGDVSEANELLLRKSHQIALSEPSTTYLRNHGDTSTSILLDFGVEFHGGIRFLTSANPSGTPSRVRLTFGESVSEAMSDLGTKNAGNDHAPRDFEVTLPVLSDLTFGETGFRFVRITLLGENAVLRLKSVLGCFVYRELDYLGSFSCSDPLLNQIYDTSVYTCHLNMQRYLWDGIKRDRLVWVGDTHPEMLTIRSVFGAHPILEDNLRFSRDEAVLPQWMNGMPSYSLWWLIITNDHRKLAGNDFIEESRDYIRGLLHQICSYVDKNGSLTLEGFFLDWQTYNTQDIARAGVHALASLALLAGEELCSALKDEETRKLCFDKRLLLSRAAPPTLGNTQAAAMQLLAKVGDTEGNLKTVLDNAAGGMSTYLSYYILTALAGNGRTKEALAILREYYGGMLALGATTFWEDFDIAWLDNAARIDEPVPSGKVDVHGDYGRHCYVGFRHSFCHGWSSGPAPFLAEQILGISLSDDGRTLYLRPNLADLTYAEGSYPTPYGIVSVSYQKNKDGSTVLTSLSKPEELGLSLDPSVTV